MELQAVKQKIQSSKDCEDSWNSFDFLENLGECEQTINETLKVSLKYSKKYRKMFLKDYEICIQPRNTGCCHGDSGGPLVCNGNTFHNVVSLATTDYITLLF